MADPRELARQAFSMLQSALASSEARAEELNEELARKPVSKDKLANKVSVLSHRLESIEEECARWKRETEQLEEVLANERAKFDSLKKKLEIAESGPDKLTKKEINYWRANAEKFDEQVNAYKSRIATLKRELREKDQLLSSGSMSPAADQPSGNTGGYDPEALAAAGAEVASLRRQIMGLNAVIADTHTDRKRLESEVAALRERISAAEQAANDPERPYDGSAAELDQMRSKNAELYASLQRAEAGLEELRRARGDLEHQHSEYEQMRSKNADLHASLQRAETSLEELRQARGDLERQLSELERVRSENTELRSSLQLSEAGLHELRCAREDLAAELAKVNRQVADDRAQQQADAQQQQLLTVQLNDARNRESALQNDLDTARQALAEREQQLAATPAPDVEAGELKEKLAQAQQEADLLRASLGQSESELAELRDMREGLAAELAELHRRIENEQAQAAEADRRQQDATSELEATQQREAALRAELDDIKRASEGQEQTARALNDAISTAESKATEAEAMVAELRAELQEEKEYSENLSELANSRQDELVKLRDSGDEARERLDDALWRLEKAKYFERLVVRRKGLIAALIEALRGKNKAMVALKAGLDSLRTHKAMVEETQQKLLMRLEALKNELGAAKERIKAQEAEAATISPKQASEDDGEIAAMRDRLTTQAELIQSLEDDIKAAKTYKRDAAEKDGEVAQLHEELETKNTIIARLQADIDEQQRKLAKLRGSDSETMRLRAVSDKDRSKIDILERENAELRAMIESADQPRPEGGEFTDAREAELQAKIADLTEAVGKWKRKYEFLSTEAPAAYQSQTAAKQ